MTRYKERPWSDDQGLSFFPFFGKTSKIETFFRVCQFADQPPWLISAVPFFWSQNGFYNIKRQQNGNKNRQQNIRRR